MTGNGPLDSVSRWMFSDLVLVVFGLVFMGHGK